MNSNEGEKNRREEENREKQVSFDSRTKEKDNSSDRRSDDKSSRYFLPSQIEDVIPEAAVTASIDIITATPTTDASLRRGDITRRGESQSERREEGRERGKSLEATRSPHPYLRTHGKVVSKKNNDQKLFWDGFQWVIKTKPIVRNLEHTVDVKKMEISGLPLELGFKAEAIKDMLNAQLNQKYHPDENIIKNVELILAQNSIAVELESRDDISKIRDTFDGEEILGQKLQVISFENKIINYNVGGVYNEAAGSSNPIAHSTKTAAQAVAITQAAIKQLEGEETKGTSKEPSIEQGNSPYNHAVATCILKIWNMVDPLYFHSRKEELPDLQLDIKVGIENFGRLADIRMVMPEKAVFGAEAGSIFAEFENIETSKLASQELKSSKYDGRVVQVAYVKPSMYEKYFKPAAESFIEIGTVQEIPAPVQQYSDHVQVTVVKEADYEFD